MAAFSDIPPQPLQDLSNFEDDIPQTVTNGNILDATRHVLQQDNTPEWITRMLTLAKYYRVNFKKRQTVQKFIRHYYFLAENKENEVYTQQQLNILHKTIIDLTNWVDKRKSDCLDDSHWPVDDRYVLALRGIYQAFPQWKNEAFQRIEYWHERMMDIKEQLEQQSSTVHGEGLTMRDIFQSHLQAAGIERVVTETQMYVDGNLIPPPLNSDTGIEYTFV